MTQADALSILKMGHNVYLTGSAGSGKTYVLNAYIAYLREHGVEVAITASTGIAATHLGGMTIHAWSGIGIKEYLSDYDIDQLEEKKYLWDRFEKVKVLVIDEISMLSGTFLDNLDRLCRSMKREENKPFGGIQLVLCGDLFQLPPISTDGNSDYATNSQAWRTAGLVVCYLTEQHRQDDDAFLGILNAIRTNTIEPHHRTLLEERINDYDDETFRPVTKLFTHNADVDAINARELSAIDNDEHVFRMTAKGKSNLIETLKKSCLAPEVLKLKLGAQVMFVKNNFDKEYVNGTRGTVVDFDETDLPVVKTLAGKTIHVDTETWSIDDDGVVLASITQVPLRHAWAITVHKSQGMSLDSAVIDLSKPFAYGMGYVALSRVRRLEGLHLVGLSDHALAVDPYILAIDEQLRSFSNRASGRLKELSAEELQLAQHDFITRSGGTLEKQTAATSFLKGQAKKPTHEISADMLHAGKTLTQIAKERDLTVGTIIGHLEKALSLGVPVNIRMIAFSPDDLEIIKQAFEAAGYEKLSPVKSYLQRAGYDFTFDTLKAARLVLQAKSLT